MHTYIHTLGYLSRVFGYPEGDIELPEAKDITILNKTSSLPPSNKTSCPHHFHLEPMYPADQ